ncbi:MAG TPA: alpha-ketoacid dehydrogenase subunit beta [Armatimonadota bacterium]|nr:alpha-ketoacid dehydrogenase subunit beta [Armatimonadota bacterium]
MATLTLVQAVNLALREELRRDERIVLLGEDVGRLGGVFRATEGLQAEFGEERVVDTPLNECGIVGAAIGMAMTGLRPCVEIQFSDFIYPAFDQIVNELAKVRYRSGGQFSAPVVIRTPYGGGVKGGHYHSQSPEAYFVHTAGLVTVVPSTPAGARGLLKSALRGEDPVIIFEPKRLYRSVRAEIDTEDEGLVPIGTVRTVRPGGDLTVLTYGAMVPPCMEAAERMASTGTEAEVIDLRTLWPVDIEAVIGSVKKTGRVLIVHEAPRACGYGAELSAQIAERAIEYLQAPIVRVTGPDTPFPYTLEAEYLPNAEKILRGAERVLKF